MEIFSESDGKSLAAELEMMRLDNQKTFVVLEGASDKKLFVHFIDGSVVEIFVSNGCRAAEGAILHAKARGVKNIVCIVDRDYSDFCNHYTVDDNIIINDDHDIEITMIKSTAFDRVLSEYGSEQKLKTISRQGAEPRDLILECAFVWGMIRLYSIQNKLDWIFEGLKFTSVNLKLAVKDADAVQEVLNKTGRPYDSKVEVLQFMDDTRAKGIDRWKICCGHDCSAILGRALRSLFGTNNVGSVDTEAIERALRLAFSLEDFRKTGLYASIKGWEAKFSRRILTML